MKNCPECAREVPDEFDICWNCSYNFSTKKKEGFSSLEAKKQKHPKDRKINCLRCESPMIYSNTIDLHEGFNWGLLGELGHFFTNEKSFEMFVCPGCNKVEFFVPALRKI